MDSLNLLIENGADMSLKDNSNMNTYDEIVRNDHKDLFECIYPYTRTYTNKRDLSQAGNFGLLHLAAGQEGSKVL